MVRFQNTSPGIRPSRKPRPIAKTKIKTSLADRSDITWESERKPNQTIAQSRIKKIGKKAKNRKPKATLRPGSIVIRLVKKTYLAQNKDVPGKPMVISTARTDKIHRRGADRATPPI